MIEAAISKEFVVMKSDDLVKIGTFDDYNADFLFNLSKDPLRNTDVFNENFDWVTVFHHTWVNQFIYSISRLGVPKTVISRMKSAVVLQGPPELSREERLERGFWVLVDGQFRTFQPPLSHGKNWNTRAKKSFEAFAYELEKTHTGVEFLGRMTGIIQSYGTPITKTGNVIYNKKVGHLLYTFAAKPATDNVISKLDYIPSNIKNPSVCDTYVIALGDGDIHNKIKSLLVQQEIRKHYQ